MPVLSSACSTKLTEHADSVAAYEALTEQSRASPQPAAKSAVESDREDVFMISIIFLVTRTLL